MRSICLYRRGRIRWIDTADLLIDKNTPRGEPANLYERKPYGGRRPLDDNELLGKLVDDEFQISDGTMTADRLRAIKSLDLKVSQKLFHNGAVYTTIKQPFKTLKQALKEKERDRHE